VAKKQQNPLFEERRKRDSDGAGFFEDEEHAP
jgi:hypothetical protein